MLLISVVLSGGAGARLWPVSRRAYPKPFMQVGDTAHKTMPGQYRYIPLKERHRLTNIGQDELVLIEVQCGGYLGEDDIVRLVDTYGRV